MEGVLDVQQATHPYPLGDQVRGISDAFDHLVAQRDRRQRAGGVPGVDPGLLDVFHHPAQVQFLAVVQGVHVDFDGVVEEPVHQHGGAVAYLRGPGDVAVQGGVVVDDLHAAPAQHETGAHQHRIADL